jgi:cell division inhibitor SulA
MKNNNNIPQPSAAARSLPTGFAELDVRLPGGGWPVGALTEVFTERLSVGELRLMMPAAARVTREGRWLALIAPPCGSVAAMLAAHGANLARLIVMQPETPQEKLRVCEQVLRAGNCGMVLFWPGVSGGRELLKLALAAANSGTAGFLFHGGPATPASPATLRLTLAGRGSRAVVRILRDPSYLSAPAPVTLDLFMGVAGAGQRSAFRGARIPPGFRAAPAAIETRPLF